MNANDQIENLLKPLPFDSGLHFAPSWEDIESKAHLYGAARIKATGEHVKIRTVNAGYWSVVTASPERFYLAKTDELCDFCL